MKPVTWMLCLLWMVTMAAATEILPVSELKPGMTGVGWTVNQGIRPEKFQVEILGTLQDQVPGEDRVLIRCTGPVIDKAGIVAGMSGSPVYINGKLVGAVSFGWEFGKEPIGGLTPIAAMRNVAAIYGTKGGDAPLRFEKVPDLNRILNPDARSLLPEALKAAFTKTPFFATGMDALPVQYLAGAAAGSTMTVPDKLEAGGPVAVALVRGDLNLFGLGTVTEVDGNRVLAFGHPMFGLGRVELPMHTAAVLATYPSYKTSNKLGALGKEVGVIVQDRNAAILGITGRRARMIPITVQINLPGASRTWRMEVAHHALLSPFLVNVSLNSLLTAVCVRAGFTTFNMQGRIDMEGHEPIQLSGLIPDASTTALTTQVATLVQSVLQNPFDPTRVSGITLTLNYVEKLRIAQIMKVKADRTRVRPGDAVHLQVYIKPFQDELFIKNVTIQVPERTRPGRYTIEVGDGFSLMSRESKALKRRIETLDGFIRLVNGFLKNNKVYVGMARKADALFMGESVQSSLPPSITDTVRQQGVHIPYTEKWREYEAVDIVTLGYAAEGYVTFPVTVVGSPQ